MEFQDFSNKKVIIAGSEGLLGQVISEKFQELKATVIGLDLKNGQNFLFVVTG